MTTSTLANAELAQLPGGANAPRLWIADDLMPPLHVAKIGGPCQYVADPFAGRAPRAPRSKYTIGSPQKGKSWTAADLMRFWGSDYRKATTR